MSKNRVKYGVKKDLGQVLKEENKFRKDLKLTKRRGKNIEKLKEVVYKLANGHALPPKNRDHNLSGNYSGFKECHIEPDWLLIYRITEIELILIRTGTHADLF
ncbi:MAG: hypothetical protein A2887_01020 [Alphaproteobacteria bacterium RIFCSPLOWO2_01_FULL_40_26]|nr:MAG: hypothetical protein A3D15_04255 [Alphaproteobacteria bacterium RIFCSPHIGHO2_02_FULL_40_34]OFW95052.1 MAG: hypothetical protein A2887_01020 [Alphaproteobacteria bacterium RIFCSPLOWO2_01_FULL_40_26]OFX10580.1 MAG: hypothetical protein A3H30_02985 [Alphaproteobacteria bacterium RIFCSPLOWO2_02_FULL_40_19]OFX12132.1 MAG: hypothetical protein A3G22_00495 [Alphaproteobacteria bacterium RIFCSPLOWO2_12_FULL_40_11]